jgi:hypothetical protein
MSDTTSCVRTKALEKQFYIDTVKDNDKIVVKNGKEFNVTTKEINGDWKENIFAVTDKENNPINHGDAAVGDNASKVEGLEKQISGLESEELNLLTDSNGINPDATAKREKIQTKKDDLKLQIASINKTPDETADAEADAEAAAAPASGAASSAASGAATPAASGAATPAASGAATFSANPVILKNIAKSLNNDNKTDSHINEENIQNLILNEDTNNIGATKPYTLSKIKEEVKAQISNIATTTANEHINTDVDSIGKNQEQTAAEAVDPTTHTDPNEVDGGKRRKTSKKGHKSTRKGRKSVKKGGKTRKKGRRGKGSRRSKK